MGEGISEQEMEELVPERGLRRENEVYVTNSTRVVGFCTRLEDGDDNLSTQSLSAESPV